MVEISSLCVVFFSTQCASVRENSGEQDILTFSSRTNEQTLKETQCTFHTPAVSITHDPAALKNSNTEHRLCFMSSMPQRPHRAPILYFIYIFLLSPAERGAYTWSHKQNKRHHLSQPAKNTQPRFLWERCPLPHRAQPKILPSTLQRPAGQLLVLSFSWSHNERLSRRQMSWCCLPLRRRWEPGSTFARPILHNVSE